MSNERTKTDHLTIKQKVLNYLTKNPEIQVAFLSKVLEVKKNSLYRTIKRMEVKGEIISAEIDGLKWIKRSKVLKPKTKESLLDLIKEPEPSLVVPLLYFHDFHLHNSDFKSTLRDWTPLDNTIGHTITKGFQIRNWHDLCEIKWKYNKNGSMEIRIVSPENTLDIDNLIRLVTDLEAMFNQDILNDQWVIKPGWGVRFANGMPYYRHKGWVNWGSSTPITSFSLWFGYFVQLYEKEVPGHPELRQMVLDLHGEHAMPFKELIDLITTTQQMRTEKVREVWDKNQIRDFQQKLMKNQTTLNEMIQTSYHNLQLQLKTLTERVGLSERSPERLTDWN